MTRLRTLFAAVATASIASLTACGGGGGTSSNSGGGSGGDGGNPPPPPTVKTVAAAATYPAGSVQAQAYAAINDLRIAAGAGAVDQSVPLDTAAQAHADYLTAVFADTSLTQAQVSSIYPHNEDSSIEPTLYYGSDYTARAQRAGLSTAASVGEGVGPAWSLDTSGQYQADAVSGVRTQADSVYHSLNLISPWTMIGLGQWTSSGATGMVIDYAMTTGQYPSSGNLAVYPYDNATVPGTFNPDLETPRPAAGLVAGLAGTPVNVSLRNADWYAAPGATVTSFTLTGPSGVVPAVILADAAIQAGPGVTIHADAAMHAGWISLLPTTPLAAGTYTASLTATIHGHVTTKAWSFTAQ